MPVISIENDNGKAKWISVFPFNSLEAARSYVEKSIEQFTIIRGGKNLYWVVSLEDAKWAVECGYEEIK